MYFVMGLLLVTACSDDDVNDFSPVPYPDEMEEPTPEPEPDPEKPDSEWKITSTTVFNSKSSDDVSYRVPAIAVTKAGTILVFCESRYGTWQDKAGRTDIIMKRSTDKGVTWTEKNVTSQAASSKLSYMDPTVVVDRVTGKIFLFTSLWDAVGKPSNQQGYNTRAIMYTSEDDGLNWTRKDLTDEVKIGIFSGFTRMIGSFGPGSGVQMASEKYKNRLIVPIRTSKVNAEAGTVSNGGNTAMWSDDNGTTWQTGQPNKSGEWTVTEAPDGALIGNIRYSGHRQCYVSTDGGAKWPSFSDYSETALPTPAKGCAGSVIVKDDYLYYCGAKGIAATENVHDDRGILYIAKAKFFDGHSHTFDPADHTVLYDKAAGYTCMALLPDGSIAIIAELGNEVGFQYMAVRPAGWMRLELFILSANK